MKIKLTGIALKREKRGVVETFTSIVVTKEGGLVDDCRGDGGLGRKRQVTILSRHQWDQACRVIGTDLPWTERRANLLIEGWSFGPNDIGKRLRIGNSVELEVTGETTPCKRMDQVCDGLRQALEPDWRGGAICRVSTPGIITVDDELSFV